MSTRSYKQALLDELYAPYTYCTKCPLGFLGRKNVVFGSGNPDTTLMLIGEGPGEQEDLQGKPFIGRSGKLLEKIFKIAEFTRDDIYISNIVKCRPPKNRAPFKSEMNMCKKLLLEKQIHIIQPKIICTLGASALQGLCKESIKITKERGIARTINNITVIPTYHPAYILRNNKKFSELLQDIHSAYIKSKSLLKSI